MISINVFGFGVFVIRVYGYYILILMFWVCYLNFYRMVCCMYIIFLNFFGLILVDCFICNCVFVIGYEMWYFFVCEFLKLFRLVLVVELWRWLWFCLFWCWKIIGYLVLINCGLVVFNFWYNLYEVFVKIGNGWVIWLFEWWRYLLVVGI